MNKLSIVIIFYKLKRKILNLLSFKKPKKKKKIIIDTSFNKCISAPSKEITLNLPAKIEKNLLSTKEIEKSAIILTSFPNLASFKTLVGKLREITRCFIYKLIPLEKRVNLTYLVNTLKTKNNSREDFKLLAEFPYTLPHFFLATTESGKKNDNPHLNILTLSNDKHW
jgi:hypothetical protein